MRLSWCIGSMWRARFLARLCPNKVGEDLLLSLDKNATGLQFILYLICDKVDATRLQQWCSTFADEYQVTM